MNYWKLGRKLFPLLPSDPKAGLHAPSTCVSPIRISSGASKGGGGEETSSFGDNEKRFLTDCSRNEHDNLPKSVNDRVNALSISRAGKRWWDELSNLIILENFFSRDREWNLGLFIRAIDRRVNFDSVKQCFIGCESVFRSNLGLPNFGEDILRIGINNLERLLFKLNLHAFWSFV